MTVLCREEVIKQKICLDEYVLEYLLRLYPEPSYGAIRFIDMGRVEYKKSYALVYSMPREVSKGLWEYEYIGVREV